MSEKKLIVRVCDICGHKKTDEVTFGGIRFYGWFRVTEFAAVADRRTRDVCCVVCLKKLADESLRQKEGGSDE